MEVLRNRKDARRISGARVPAQPTKVATDRRKLCAGPSAFIVTTCPPSVIVSQILDTGIRSVKKKI
jgi:hypothetical protein